MDFQNSRNDHMTSEQAARLVELLKAGYPTKRITDETLVLYQAKFQAWGIDYDKVASAISSILDHSPFWPQLSEILDRARPARNHEKREVLPPVNPDVIEQMRAYAAKLGKNGNIDGIGREI